MSYIVRFGTTHGVDTYLARPVPGQRVDDYRVGLQRRGTRADPIPLKDAARFDTREEATLALGNFILQRSGWAGADWLRQPCVVEEKPVTIVTASWDLGEISLRWDDGEYVIDSPGRVQMRADRPDAIEVFLKAVAEALA